MSHEPECVNSDTNDPTGTASFFSPPLHCGLSEVRGVKESEEKG